MIFLISFEIKERTILYNPAGILCWKSSIKVPKQTMEYVQSQEERPQNNIIDAVLEP